MIRWLRSSALALLFSSVLPFAAPDLFIYKSAHAEAGPKIPDWISAACCGPQDAHKLRADQVYENENGTWHVDGYEKDVAITTYPNGNQDPPVRASQDANAWAFYRDQIANGGQGPMYCIFFVPML